MQITSLQAQATQAERINIFIDGKFLLAASALTVLQMGLQVGQELSETQLEQLRHEEALQQALKHALNYLSLRPRSRQEVRNYLHRKNTPPALIDPIMERLDRLDLVNDRAFAAFWLEAREQFRPKGSYALKNELCMKGVQRDLVDELVDEERDEERALHAARKKAQSLLHQPAIDYATFYRRLGSFLQRRGFGYDVVTRTVKQLWEELKHKQVDDMQESW
jgi:regulatory protein